MLNRAISFSPALRVMGRLILKRGTVPFPYPLAEEKLDSSAHYGRLVTNVWYEVGHFLYEQNMLSYFHTKTRERKITLKFLIDENVHSMALRFNNNHWTSTISE